jgi:hypothetical protein
MERPSASGRNSCRQRKILDAEIERAEARMGARGLGDPEECCRCLDHRDEPLAAAT